jgi:glycosyltransferase involved in cell wall biosynthesis
VIVGNGVELERLRKLASDLGLAESVTFLGAVNHDVVLETLRRADIFVLPSEYESFGVATAEAMAAGLPVVVTRTTGCLDLVEDGKTGFLVPVGDPVVLASRLRELIEHPDRRRLMGMAGRRKAEREFSFAQHMQAMEKVWDQAANAGRSREVEYCAV